MRKKKLMSIGLSVALLMSSATVGIQAEQESVQADNYEFVDLSNYANCIGFVQTGVLTTDDGSGKRYTQISSDDGSGNVTYESTGIEYDVPQYMGVSESEWGLVNNQQYNAAAWDGARNENGYICAANGIPFDVKTSLSDNNFLLLSGKGAIDKSNETITIPTGTYKEIYFLMDSINEPKSSQFKLKINYSDGSSFDSGITQLAKKSESLAGNLEISTTLGVVPPKWDSGVIDKSTGMCYRMDREHENPLSVNYLLPVYKIDVDMTKEIQSVYIEQVGADKAAMLLAVTGVRAEQSDIVSMYIDQLPDANEVNENNYFDYAGRIAYISKALSDGIEIDAGDLEKYEAVKSIVNKFEGKYTVFDLSESANAVGFGTTGVLTASDNADDFIQWEGQIQAILNKAAFDYHAKSDGKIYSSNGVPFSISSKLDGSKNIIKMDGSVEFPKNTIIPLKEGNYKQIYLTNVGVNGSYVDFKMRVRYTDESVTPWISEKAYMHDAVKSNYPDGMDTIDCFYDGYDGNNRTNTALLYRNNKTEPYASGYYLPVHTIDVDVAKTVKSVEIETNSAATQGMGILAMTALNKTVVDYLDAYSQNAENLTKAEVDAAYEMLRCAVADGEAQWFMYIPIINRKAERGVVTVNDAKIRDAIFKANINVADLGVGYDSRVILAVYENNKLISVQEAFSGEIKISDSGKDIEVSLAGYDTDSKVKCFVWDSNKDMSPLAEVTIR